MAKFQVGDVVRLNSDGPNMTVESVDPVPMGVVAINGRMTPPTSVRTDLVACTWFDGKKRMRDRFKEDVLTLVSRLE